MARMSLNETEQKQLLNIARLSIAQGLKTGKSLKIHIDEYQGKLTEIRASFVTLERNHELRGCVGKLEAVKALVEDVAENAYAAAFLDRRFTPLDESEFADLHVHISILSPPEPMQFTSEADLLAQLRPNIDGLILKVGYRQATFLPTVWESLPEPSEFLKHLKRKAGLAADYWGDDVKAYRYFTESVG